MFHKRILLLVILVIVSIGMSGCDIWSSTGTFDCYSFSLTDTDPVEFDTDNTGSNVQVVYLRVYDSRGTLFDGEVARGTVGSSILAEGTVNYSRKSVGGDVFAELYSPAGGALAFEQFITDYRDTINCPFTIPNLGVIQIDVTMAQPAYAEPGGEIAKADGNEIWLPHDADSNGYDTYTVTDTQTIEGRTWVNIFLGSEDFVWVPLDQVKVVSYLEE